MTQNDRKEFLINLFVNLRMQQFQLGIRDLLEAYKIINDVDTNLSLEIIKEFILRIWCHSYAETEKFIKEWEKLTISVKDPIDLKDIDKTSNNLSAKHNLPKEIEGGNFEVDKKTNTLLNKADYNWGVLPVKAPNFLNDSDLAEEMENIWPISSRNIDHAWRHFRQYLSIGPRDIINISETVNQVAKQGFFLEPYYDRRKEDQSHLLLIVDRNGSMVPFHAIAQQIIKSARKQQKSSNKIDIYYFHNIPNNYIYFDMFLTNPISLRSVLKNCTSSTGIMIISDCGAARGHRSPERIQANFDFIYTLKLYTSNIVWVNPVPKERWTQTTAQITSHFLPMFSLNQDDFLHSIDILRGL